MPAMQVIAIVRRRIASTEAGSALRSGARLAAEGRTATPPAPMMARQRAAMAGSAFDGDGERKVLEGHGRFVDALRRFYQPPGHLAAHGKVRACQWLPLATILPPRADHKVYAGLN